MRRRTLPTKDQLQPPSRSAQENTTYQGSASASFKECAGEYYLPRISFSLLQGVRRRTLPTKDQLQPPSRSAQENTTYQGSSTASFKECAGEHYLPRISYSLLQGVRRRTLPTKDQLQPPSRSAQENTTYQGSATAALKECAGEYYLPRISFSLLQGVRRRTLPTKDHLQPPSRSAQENTTYQGSATASFKECAGEHYLPRISFSLLQGVRRRTLPTKDQLQPPSRSAQENTTYQGYWQNCGVFLVLKFMISGPNIRQICARYAPDVHQLRARYVPDMCQMYARYVPDVRQICARCTPDMCQICARYVPDVRQICARCTPAMCQMYARYVPDVRQICVRYVPDTRQMYARYAPDVRQIRARYAPDVRQIRARCTPDTCQLCVGRNKETNKDT